MSPISWHESQLNQQRKQSTAPPVTDTTRLTRRPSIEYRGTSPGGMLVDLETGACFTLNDVGAAIWKKLEGNQTIAEIVAGIQAGYQIAPERAREDVFQLCNAILAAGLADVGPAT